jgi:hypothetical protein
MALPRGVINVNAAFTQRKTTSKKTGRIRLKNFRIDIEADDLIVDLRARETNAEFTGLLQEILNTQWGRVTETVSPTTLARRESAARNPGSKANQRRYAGGKIGALTPNQTPYKFRDSNRMRHTTIRLRPGGSKGQGAATINVPANRLDPTTFGNQAQFQQMLSDLRRLIPLIGGRIEGETKKQLDQGMTALLEGIVSNNEKRYQQLLRRRNRVLRQLLRAFGINADAFAFTQQIRLQRGVRQGKRVDKQTAG